MTVNQSTTTTILRPDAGAMLSSLRAIGYSLPTAVADLVDNSVSAGAKSLAIDGLWAGADTTLRVVDDGRGMSREELLAAMRLGGVGPDVERAALDLGRFGLGLKTASFSQCRRLTVVTRSSDDQDAHGACWDLDHVRNAGEWELLLLDPAATQQWADQLPTAGTGTVVVWEHADRIVGSSPDAPGVQARFREQLRLVQDHLALTFHRFLRGSGRVTISVNGNEVVPVDPFMEDHDATQNLGDEPLHFHGATVRVTPFVLPHRSKLTEAERRIGGLGDWNGHQGFFIYRNRRLLVAGDWLRLFSKEEHHKLARIRVELPNTLDDAWQIDVRKAIARPPGVLREQLKRIAISTRRDASEVYRFRGKAIARSATSGNQFLWERREGRGRISYRVNREHPLVRGLIAGIPEVTTRLNALLRMIEETVPVPLIVIDTSSQPDAHEAPFESAPEADILQVMQELYAAVRNLGASHEEALERLARTDGLAEHRHLLPILEELAE
jgi:hypothetical protein